MDLKGDGFMNQLILPMMGAIFLAINMGGSGIGSSFSSVYGSNMLRKDLIPGLYGLFVLAGALLSGGKTMRTLGEGVVNQSVMDFKVVSILLISVGISIFIANILKVPQSTSQATVLSLIAIAGYFGKYSNTRLLYSIFLSWALLPILSFFLLYALGKYIYKPTKEKGYVSYEALEKHKGIFILVVLSSCVVAYSIGANNVANASAPLYSMFESYNVGNGMLNINVAVSIFLVAPWFGIGGSIFSEKILKSTGEEIVKFGPLGALAISFVNGILIVIASHIGFPVALAQVNVGSILGIRAYKNGIVEAIRDKRVNKIFKVWIVTPIIAFLITKLLLSLFI